VQRVFSSLVTSLKKEATAICCADSSLKKLLPLWRKDAACQIVTYGSSDEADFRLLTRHQSGLTQNFTFSSQKTGDVNVTLPMGGEYNALNALACITASITCGVKLEGIVESLSSYRQVRRRQEVKYEGEGRILIEDFAHHPTSVRAVISAVREAYPRHTLWAVFEPRSNTSRRKIFEEDYISGFKAADKAIISEVIPRKVDEGLELIDVHALATSISDVGTDCVALPDAGHIAEYLLGNVGNQDVILVMSNGGFGGLIQLLERGLNTQAS